MTPSPSRSLFFVQWQPFIYEDADSSSTLIAWRVGNIYKRIANSLIHFSEWFVNGMLGTYYAWTGRIVIAMDAQELANQQQADTIIAQKSEIERLTLELASHQEQQTKPISNSQSTFSWWTMIKPN